ncbi:MAG: transposase [Burkholderiales bacterium]|nr:transposase [Burkholderiales bacterium]
MTEYRRLQHPGATWFFTVNLAERRGNRLLTDHIDGLRTAFSHVKRKHLFKIDAVGILPDHLHCIWTLPEGDSDFSMRWGLIKAHFSRQIAKGERISKSRTGRGERGLWQRRFWEHLIRDETDYRQHMDYIHWDPVKHGWVRCVKEWPHSSFHRYVIAGVYAENWGNGVDLSDRVARE